MNEVHELHLLSKCSSNRSNISASHFVSIMYAFYSEDNFAIFVNICDLTASETWKLTKRDRKQMNIFLRKVYSRIFGPVYGNEKENWRILTNKEIYASVKNLLK